MRNNNLWLYLLTLGRKDEAKEILRSYDDNGEFFALSGYLFYTTFDPADFPGFSKHLADQGISRPPAVELPFACAR